MKKNTLKTVRYMLMLLKRHEAYFFDDDGKVSYTYMRGGWVRPATIDGKPLEYVGSHDDTPLEFESEWAGIPHSGLPILNKVRRLA